MVTIVDYGVGNLASVAKMVRAVGGKAIVSGSAEAVASAEKLILPGVGSFDFGMTELRERGLIESLMHCARERTVPILGICLGAQLMTNGSEEGVLPGLGWIRATTKAFDRSRMQVSERVPNMGWADLTVVRPSRLLSRLPDPSRFYLVHSYHLVCEDESGVIGRMHHGYAFDVAFEYDNLLGVQFHPEKSHRFGMQVIRNFIELY